MRVAQAPQPCPRSGGHSGEDDLGVGSGHLRYLVEDDHRAGGRGGAVEREPGDSHGGNAGMTELAGRLVRRRQSDHRMPGT